MPSTRKQKAKERRSRQLEMLSDVENVDIMLGSYSREDEDNNASENEATLVSGSSRPQQSSNTLGENFRSLFNTNSRENSEITIETTRLINEEISNQMSRKLNKIKNSLKIQIQDAISSAITEQILHSIQNTLQAQRRTKRNTMDQGSIGLLEKARATGLSTRDKRSSELQRNFEVENSHNIWVNHPRKCFMQENIRQMSRQSSIESEDSEQICDMVTGANPTPHTVPEFLTGRPMQSREPLQHQDSNNDEPQNTTPQVPEATTPTTGRSTSWHE